MTASVTLINTSTDTWETVINRVNQLANLASNAMMTVDSTTTGSVTTGNAYGNGIFAYSTLVAENGLRGGTVDAAGLLTVTSNVIISTGNNLSLGNSTVNVYFTETSATFGGNLTINSTAIFAGNSTVNVHITGTTFSMSGGPTINSTAFSGFGVFGNTTTTSNAVTASSNTGYGLYAFSNTNYGLYGVTTSGVAGVFGTSTTNTQSGVYGLSNSGAGIQGHSNSSHGVYGTSNTGSGIVSNNGIVLQNGDANFSNSVTALQIPSGTTAQRPANGNGKIRYNTTESIVEMYVGGAWDNVVTYATQLKVYDSANSQVFP